MGVFQFDFQPQHELIIVEFFMLFLSLSRQIVIVIYLRSFDPRKGYCPLDIEHVIISIHNTM